MPKKTDSNLFVAAIAEFLERHPTAPMKPRRLARAMAIADADYPSFRDAFGELRCTGRLSLPPRKGRAPTLVGRFKANPSGYGFVTPCDAASRGSDVFVPVGRTGGALTGDTVVVELRSAKPRERKEPGRDARRHGEVVRILERGLERAVGTLELVDGGWFLEPDGGEITTPVIVDGIPGSLPGGDGNALSPGTKVLVEITQYPEGPGLLPVGVVVESLGREGTLDAETAAVILRHDLPHRFSEDALGEADRAVASFDPGGRDAPGSRVDLRSLPLVTIDPVDARDYDDAVSLHCDDRGRRVLGVHIADVAAFVPEGSALDLEARERGTSVYFPRRVVPMLPQVLSQGVCALAPDQPRYAISVFVTYDERGGVLARSVVRSIISSRRRLTYEEAQRICDGVAEDVSTEVAELVTSLARLAREIEARRAGRGMLDLDLPEVDLVLDDSGRVVGARPAPEFFTHTLIEMLMVEANEAIATLLDEHGLRPIRRVHPPPAPDGFGLLRRLAQALGRPLPPGPPSRPTLQRLVAAVRGQPMAQIVNLALLRSLEKARYSTEPLEHFALASSCYCHFTSPIRRYPDLLVHRMTVKHLVHGSDTPVGEQRPESDDGDAQEALAEHCSETERRAEEAEQELRLVLLLQHLAGKVGERFEGVITGVTGFGPFVQSPTYLVEGLVPRDSLGGWWEVDADKGVMVDETSGATLRLGDVVEVAIDSVDVARRRLDLRLVRAGDAIRATARRPRPRRGAPGDEPRGARRREAQSQPGRARRRTRRGTT